MTGYGNDTATGSIGEYTTSGATVNASLVSGLAYPTAIAASGSDLFVANSGLSFGAGTIGEYTSSGATVNASLVSGVGQANSIAVTGSVLYATVGNYEGGKGPVLEYSTSGTSIGVPLITSSNPYFGSGGIAVNGLAPVIPASTATTVSTGQSYTTIAPVTSTGGEGTVVSFLAGKAVNGQTVTVDTLNTAVNFTNLASDVVSVSGNDGNVFALQLTFDPLAANHIGGAASMTLLYDSPGVGWENAILGDHGTNVATGGSLDFQGSFAVFENYYEDTHGVTLTDANLALVLGAYGVDPTNDTVWAVIDHNSDFGTGSLTILPEDAPEPSIWGMLVAGTSCMLVYGWKSRHSA